jgi:hypothetical protein
MKHHAIDGGVLGAAKQERCLDRVLAISALGKETTLSRKGLELISLSQDYLVG